MVQVTKKNLNGKVQVCRFPDPIRRQWYLQAKKAAFFQDHTSEISLRTSMIRRLVDHLDGVDANFIHIHGGYNTISGPLRPIIKTPSLSCRYILEKEAYQGKTLVTFFIDAFLVRVSYS